MDCLIRYDFTKPLRVSSLKNSFYFDLLTRHDVLIERKKTFARFVRRNFMRRRANERFVSVDGTRRIEKSHVQLVTREQRVRFHAENQAHPSFLSTNRVRDLLVGFDSRLIRNVLLSLSLSPLVLPQFVFSGRIFNNATDEQISRYHRLLSISPLSQEGKSFGETHDRAIFHRQMGNRATALRLRFGNSFKYFRLLRCCDTISLNVSIPRGNCFIAFTFLSSSFFKKKEKKLYFEKLRNVFLTSCLAIFFPTFLDKLFAIVTLFQI